MELKKILDHLTLKPIDVQPEEVLTKICNLQKLQFPHNEIPATKIIEEIEFSIINWVINVVKNCYLVPIHYIFNNILKSMEEKE